MGWLRSNEAQRGLVYAQNVSILSAELLVYDNYLLILSGHIRESNGINNHSTVLTIEVWPAWMAHNAQGRVTKGANCGNAYIIDL